MKFWLSLVGVYEVEQYIEIARFAEDVGFYGITIADHLIWPTKIKSKYPYLDDGEVWWPENMPWPDPWITLATLGASTNNIKLATNIYLAALRDPLTAAKAIGTTAVFNPDRVVAGLSAGWIKEEYDIANINFQKRGKRLDETIDIMKQLWTGKPINYEGELFRIDNAVMCPVPTSDIPVWSGGHSQAALKRAARNDGWLGLPLTIQQIEETAAMLFKYRKDYGKEKEPFEITFNLLDQASPENLHQLDELGVSNMMVLPWIPSPWDGSSYIRENESPSSIDVKKKSLERFADQVINLVT